MRKTSTASLMALTLGLLSAAAVVACTSTQTTCPAGQTACNGICVDLSSDVAHCGMCAISCPLTATCAGGSCTCPAATPDSCGTRCVNKQSDAANCGNCGFACGLGTCLAAACQCDAGATKCSGACVNTQVDKNNCGACGNTCASGFSCVSGACTCVGDACPPPPATPTICTSFQTDSANCGGCGVVCGPNETCAAAACACAGGFTSCNGACVDLKTDATNCGTCGNACGAGRSCSNGQCVSGCVGVTCDGGAICCPGDACCGGTSCQAHHYNGVGNGYFYACTPVGTYDLALAKQAASQWAVGYFDVDNFTCGGNTTCLARYGTVGGKDQCAVWCYDGQLEGQMGLNPNAPSCQCPPTSPLWASWY